MRPFYQYSDTSVLWKSIGRSVLYWHICSLIVNGECSGLNCRDQTTVQFTTAGPCIVTGNDNVLIVYDVVKLSGLPSMLHSFSCGVEVSGTAGIWCTPQSISVMSTFQQVGSRQLTVCRVLRDSCLHGKCKYKLMYWIGWVRTLVYRYLQHCQYNRHPPYHSFTASYAWAPICV